MAGGTYRATLRHPGLQAFLWTQFLGAFNDNLFKIIVAFYLMASLPSTTATALTAAAFIGPFLLFSGYAGYLADVHSKRSVLVTTKVLEVGAMLIAAPALVIHRIDVMVGALLVLAVIAVFFSPAKYGIVPEIVPDEDLSRANGLLEMSTFVAIIAGTWVGGELFEAWRSHPAWLGMVLIAIAGVGALTSLGIPRVPRAKCDKTFAWNPFAEISRGIARVYPSRTLWMTLIGISFFWFLGAFLQMVLVPYGLDVLKVSEGPSTRLFTWLAIGIATGSLAAGRLSGDRVEPGLVPIGAFGMGAFSLVLAFHATSYVVASVSLGIIGFSAGLFVVPLNALLQQRAANEEKGRIMATNNFLNTVGALIAAGLVYFMTSTLGLHLDRVLLIAGLFTLAATVYVLLEVPDFFLRFTLWILAHTLYRIKIVGRPHIPQSGPALLVSNHVSMIDGALVGACVQRFVRFLVYGPHFRLPIVHWLLKHMHAIPVTAGERREVVAAIQRAHEELAAGHVVCIFAEGAVSRTGNLLPFKRGFERIVEGLDVPIIPVYLDRVWGSIFSFKRGRFFWKLPERLPYPVTVAFGRPLPSTATASEVRLAIMELGADAMQFRRAPDHLLHTEFIRVAKRRWRRLAMADSTGQKLTYGRALVGSLLLGRLIANRSPGEETIGLLLPASVGGALANIATLMAGRVPVNLNFTIGQEAMDRAIADARIRTVITSRRFLDKASLPERPGMLFLEELAKQFTGLDKLRALLEARLLPVSRLRRRYAGAGRSTDALATVVFSSGSTGVPKGVMITHANVLGNVDAIAQIFPMDDSSCFIGVLPFFHSFGFTGTLWYPLLQGSSVAFHPNPMDAKTIGELAGAYRATMLIATPTFCHGYLRRCTKEQFAHLKYAIVGAEKLREPLATAFEQQYGVPLLEGYGCTEMSPVVAVNRPNIDHPQHRQIGTKFGSVGHPIPGVAAKVVDRETGEGPIFGREGLLLVKGPNLMAGYLNQPALTAEVLRDGWYVTGDVAMMDEDGFIFITDRLSRFSKIGGEMVPHLKIEEAINGICGEFSSVVTAVPDASRGERIVAFYTRVDVSSDALWERLNDTDLPKLWLPRRESLFHIEAIPVLGTGKIDLRRVREMAAERTPGQEVRKA